MLLARGSTTTQFKSKSHFSFFTLYKMLPCLSIMYKQSSFLSAAMTENPGSGLQKIVPSIGFTLRLNDADEFTT